jgi:hypothetical protein
LAIVLTKTSETSSKITFAFTPVMTAVGYVFFADEKRVSNTWDPLKSSITFSKGAARYRVDAVGVRDSGTYTVDSPPPSGNLSIINPPRTPFAQRDSMLFVREFGSGVTDHIHVTSSPDFGIGVMQWPPASWQGTYIVRDCIAENVVLPPFDLEGFNEACFWFGQTLYAYRFLGRNAEWMGMFTGSRFVDSVVEHFQLIDQPWVGLYPEHVSGRSVFRKFNIESRKNGVNVEWTYHDDVHSTFYDQQTGLNAGGKAGSFGLKFYDGRIRVQEGYSFYLDAGTFGCEIGVEGYLDVNKPIMLPTVLSNPDRPNIVQKENINFNGIPANQQIQYHSNPMGVYRAPRLAFGLSRGRIEGKLPHQKIRDWEKTNAMIDGGTT